MMAEELEPMSKLLSELLPNPKLVSAKKDRVVTGIQMDSRLVKSGDLFLALKGLQSDGRQFISQAIENGAVAVLAEKGIDGQLLKTYQKKAPVIEIERLNPLAGLIASKFFDQPSTHMKVLAVTGTNGKTTCTYLLAQALELLGEKAGVIGTLGYGVVPHLQNTNFTTPDAVSMQRCFSELVDEAVSSVAIEISSHGLDQYRVSGTAIKAALFTNLSRDHLDYHGDMASYSKSKERLFYWPNVEHVIINSDDIYGRGYIEQWQGSAELTSYGFDTEFNPDVHGRQLRMTEAGMRFQVVHGGFAFEVQSQLMGRFNAANLLGVIGMLLKQEFTSKQIQEVIPKLTPPAGRMERVMVEQGPAVVVDYAHTPDALENVLNALKQHATGKLICLFGCGGDRDKGKRPLMGAVAEQCADEIVITSDNPRSEDPEQIIQDILAGMTNQQNAVVEANRAKAIQQIIEQAKQGDLILIAGKGHERYQEIKGKKFPFDDKEQAEKALHQWSVKGQTS